MHYSYWGFGLKILSEIEFPELLPFKFISPPNITFRIGKVPEEMIGNTFSGTSLSYTINENELLFEGKDVAHYYTSNGEEVVIAPIQPVEDWRGIRLHVLASVMASVLQQKKRLPLHASALLHKNSLILITGDSGAGKSTSVAGLMKRGHTIFSDDVTVLEKKDDQILAQASYPMIKLWDDTMIKMDHALFVDRSFKVREDLDKFGVFFHESFDMNKYPSSKIFILKKGEVDVIKNEKISGAEAFKEVYKQIYRPMLMVGNDQLSNAFSLISLLTDNCEVIRITRPLECDPEDLLDVEEALITQDSIIEL